MTKIFLLTISLGILSGEAAFAKSEKKLTRVPASKSEVQCATANKRAMYKDLVVKFNTTVDPYTVTFFENGDTNALYEAVYTDGWTRSGSSKVVFSASVDGKKVEAIVDQDLFHHGMVGKLDLTVGKLETSYICEK